MLGKLWIKTGPGEDDAKQDQDQGTPGPGIFLAESKALKKVLDRLPCRADQTSKKEGQGHVFGKTVGGCQLPLRIFHIVFSAWILWSWRFPFLMIDFCFDNFYFFSIIKSENSSFTAIQENRKEGNQWFSKGYGDDHQGKAF